jgi:hypothetical protein
MTGVGYERFIVKALSDKSAIWLKWILAGKRMSERQ